MNFGEEASAKTQFEVSEKNIRLIPKHLSFAINVKSSAKPRNKLVATKEFWAIVDKKALLFPWKK